MPQRLDPLPQLHQAPLQHRFQRLEDFCCWTQPLFQLHHCDPLQPLALHPPQRQPRQRQPEPHRLRQRRAAGLQRGGARAVHLQRLRQHALCGEWASEHPGSGSRCGDDLLHPGAVPARQGRRDRPGHQAARVAADRQGDPGPPGGAAAAAGLRLWQWRRALTAAQPAAEPASGRQSAEPDGQPAGGAAAR